MMTVEQKLEAHMVLLVEQEKRIKRLEEAIENLEGYVKGEIKDRIRDVLRKSYEQLSG